MPNPRTAAEWVRTIPLDCPHLEARELYVCYECAAANLDAYARQQVEAAVAGQREVIRKLMAACDTLMDEVTKQKATKWGIVNDAMVAGAAAIRALTP